MDNSTSLDLEMRVNWVYNLLPKLGNPITIVKDERMMEMKRPKLRKSPKVVRIPSSFVLDVVAADRVLFSLGLLHESVFYSSGGVVGTSNVRSYECLQTYGRSSFALLCLVAWLSTRKLLHLAWLAVILLGFLLYMIFPAKNGIIFFSLLKDKC